MITESHNFRTLRQILTQHCTPSEECIRDFENAAVLCSVARGEAVVRQGEVCDYFVFNRVGLLRVCNVTDGVEDTLLFGTSGDVFTSLHSYYNGEPSIFSLIAVVDSEVWTVSYYRMKMLSDKYPELVVWMRNLLIEQLYGFEKRYVFFNNKTAEDRFLNFLRINYGSLRRAPIKYISRIVALKYIAQYLKITPSTLSRLRKKLVSGGDE